MTITLSPIAEYWDYTDAAPGIPPVGGGGDKDTDITADETWTGQINIMGSFQIRATVTIEPGTTVTWFGAFTITVASGGLVDVNGTESNQVKFRRLDTVSGKCEMSVTNGNIVSQWGNYYGVVP